MKKNYYLAAALSLFGVTAQAAAGPVGEVPAEAVASTYCLAGFYYENNMFLEILDGVPETIYQTDDAFYFGNLFPRMLEDAPVKGSYDAATGLINIPTQHFYNYDSGEGIVPFYFTRLQVDDMGNVTGVDDSGLDMRVNADGTITTEGGNNVYFGIVDEAQNVYARARNLAFAPFDGVETILPEGAVLEDVLYSVYNNRSEAPEMFVAQMAQVGDEVYMNGLTSNNAWLKGTLQGDRLTMPNGQYLGDDPMGFIYVVNGVKNLHTDPETWREVWEDADAITFTCQDGIFVLDEGLSVAEMTPGGQIRSSFKDVVVKPFEGFSAATPLDPFSLSFMDMSEFFGQMAFSFGVANAGTQGEFLDENGLEVSVYIDGDQLTLDPADGYAIDEPMVWVPYGFADNNWGMDINFTSLWPSFWLYESMANELGAQVRYTYDDQTHYSNIVYVDAEGNTRTEEAGNTTGISPLTQQLSMQCFDMQGRPASGQAQGFGIVRMQTSKGVKTVKVLRR